MNVFKYLFIVLSTLLLNACGGGGGAGGISFASLEQSGADLIVKHYYQPATPLSRMPSGSATFTGVAAFNNTNVASVNDFISTADPLAKLTLYANFSSNSISGSVTDIKSWNGSATSGSVTISNGRISGNTFLADANGVVFYEGSAAAVNAAVDGVFLGYNAEAVFGSSVGTFGSQPFYGLYLAEQ